MVNKYRGITIRVMLLLFVIVSMIVTLAGCSGKDVSKIESEFKSIFDDKYVTMVKKGHLKMAPNITIDEAFTNFFGDPKWKSFEATTGQRVVEFSGKCTWEDKPATCRMQFIVDYDNGTFETGAVSINGTDLNVLETAIIMAKIIGESVPDDTTHSNSMSQSKVNNTTTNSIEKQDNSKFENAKMTNARLGNVTLGDTLADTERKLGEATKKEVRETNKLRYAYPAMDVAYDYGKVVGMAADDSNVATPKGIHTGSSLQDVFNSYGSNYMLSTYNDLDLYEYKFEDENGSPYILRFAVKQGTDRVNYISIRYAD